MTDLVVGDLGAWIPRGCGCHGGGCDGGGRRCVVSTRRAPRRRKGCCHCHCHTPNRLRHEFPSGSHERCAGRKSPLRFPLILTDASKPRLVPSNLYQHVHARDVCPIPGQTAGGVMTRTGPFTPGNERAGSSWIQVRRFESACWRGPWRSEPGRSVRCLRPVRRCRTAARQSPPMLRRPDARREPLSGP